MVWMLLFGLVPSHTICNEVAYNVYNVPHDVVVKIPRFVVQVKVEWPMAVNYSTWDEYYKRGLLTYHVEAINDVVDVYWCFRYSFSF
jgi:hypothetical protein